MASKETANWLEGLKAEGKISDEVLATLKTATDASSDLDNYIKGSALRQGDYSRVMGEIQKAQKDVENSQRLLQEKEVATTKFQTELGEWKAGAQKNYDKALAERETAERKAAAYIAKLKNVAAASGFDPDEILKELDVVEQKPVETAQPQFDAAKYLTIEQAQKFTAEAAYLDAMIYDIGEQHRDLFGSRLPNAKELVAEAVNSKQSIEQVWKNKYKVDDKIKERSDADVQKRIDDAVTTERNKILSERGLPNPRPDRNTDPYTSHKLFSNPALKAEAEKAHHNDLSASSEGVSAAVASFNEGKYKATR